MPELLSSLLPLAAVLSFGIFVQAAAGFAAGLLTIPILLWLGYLVPEATTALLIATIPQNVLGVWDLRKDIPRHLLLWPGVARVVAFPIGVLTLLAVEKSSSIVGIRQMVGAAVLAATLAIIFFKPKPRERLHPIWSVLAFPLSGFCQGIVGMGGPLMVFWVQAHDWSTRQMRGFLFGMYLISIPTALAVLAFYFRERILEPLLLTVMALPALVIATKLGLRCGDLLGRQRLRKITLGLLLLVGISGLAAPWIKPGENPQSLENSASASPGPSEIAAPAAETTMDRLPESNTPP